MTQNSVHAARPLVRASKPYSFSQANALGSFAFTAYIDTGRATPYEGAPSRAMQFWPHLAQVVGSVVHRKTRALRCENQTRRCAESEVRCVTVQGMKIDSGLIDVTIRRRVRYVAFARAGAMTVGDRRLARLLNSFPEIVVVLDGLGKPPVGQRTWPWTSSVERWSRAVGMSGLEPRAPDDLEIVLRSLESVQTKSVGSPLEIRVQDWRRLEADRIDRYSGALVCKGRVLFSIRDLTDRRRFEMARDNVARFRSLVHNATTIMMYVPVVTLNQFPVQ